MNALKLRTGHVLGAAMAAVNSVLLSALALAQTSGPSVDIDVNTPGNHAWYGQWYLWAIGIAVFLVVVIALTNRGSGREA